MRWITGITLNNYRAFAKSETIAIPRGQHLLIYGENGSGKSSIYNAVKDFFTSSFQSPTTTFNLNEFEKEKKNENGNVTLKIAEQDLNGNPVENDYIFSEPISGSTHQHRHIQLANKVKGFLDYKKMLQVHALNVPANKQPNIFNLIVKDLLGEHRVSNPGSGTTSVDLLEEYNRLAQILCLTPSHYRTYKTAEAELNKLDAELLTLLNQVFTEANKFLNQYFKNKISLDVRYNHLKIHKPAASSKRQMREELSLRVKYAGKEIEYYHAFLNEARLSALAVCLYLASIKTNSLSASDLRVLFLDDVFIGLDTCNRIPLLEILRDEFIKQDFQIFISTYDRQWFELARQWFNNNTCKFKTLELYIEDDGNPNTPEQPVLIDKNSDHFENAQRHFDAKDYPAAANYLRKACESELKRILPRNKTLTANPNTGEVRQIYKLETLVDNFFEFVAKNGLDSAPFNQFGIYKKIILNPLSHDDLEAPHYRREIQDGIHLVNCLQQIKSKVILTAADSAKRPMKLGVLDTASKIMRKYEITILENLRILQQGSASIKLSSVECKVVEGTTTIKFNTLQAVFDQIRIDRNYPAKTDYDDFYKNIKISTRKRLSDSMVF